MEMSIGVSKVERVLASVNSLSDTACVGASVFQYKAQLGICSHAKQVNRLYSGITVTPNQDGTNLE